MHRLFPRPGPYALPAQAVDDRNRVTRPAASGVRRVVARDLKNVYVYWFNDRVFFLCHPCRCPHRKTTFISCAWSTISSLPYLTYPLPTGGAETAIYASGVVSPAIRPAAVHHPGCGELLFRVISHILPCIPKTAVHAVIWCTGQTSRCRRWRPPAEEDRPALRGS